MIQRYEHNKTTWLDVLSPTADEIRDIMGECDLPPEFSVDLNAPTPKTETFSKNGYLKITLDFPIVKRTDLILPHEIKFIVTKTHLVTIRFNDIEAVHRFSKEYEVIGLLHSTATKKTSSDLLFLTMLNFLYVAMHGKLDYLESRLKDVEDEIFEGHERDMVFELSQIGRRLISFRQTIGAHENALEKLPTAMKTAFGKVDMARIDELEHHYRSLNRHLYALTSVLSDLKDTNNALLYTKQNEVMKLFTILAFITFPLTLFSSMFGMNTEATPIIGHKYDFWIIASFMVVVSFAFFWFIRSKNWL